MKKLALLVLALSLSVSGWAQEEPQTSQPGWLAAAERPVPQTAPKARAAAPRFVGSATGLRSMSLVSAPEIAEAITPDIQALARGLENDPKQIYDYVHDHIRYVHYFGSKKGAQLTLLERSGNDFDQCALLVSLLRAAGHTANYCFGLARLPYESQAGDGRDFKHWLGLTKPETNVLEAVTFAVRLSSYRGYPDVGTYYYTDGSDDLWLHRVWVKLTWNNMVYWLDPAFKVHERIEGIDLAAAMNLDTNQLMAAAGGTGNANYIQNLTESTLRNKLRDYTVNLLGTLQTNYPNASVEEIRGGQRVVSSSSEPLNNDLGGLAFGFTDSGYTSWDYVPTNLMSALTIAIESTNRVFWMPQLQGQRLSLTFDSNGLAQLWLEDELLLQKQATGGTAVSVAMSVNHPFGTWDWTNNTLVNTDWNDQAASAAYQATNASYAISYAFEPDQEWLRQRQDRLDRYRQQGLPDTSREVVTETLNVMGLNWMLQTERLAQLLAVPQQVLSQEHHRVGRMAQEAGRGYYVDVYMENSGIYSASGLGPADDERRQRVFDVQNYFGSAAEHGLIEQMQSSNLMAASTVKMLQIGNTNAQKTYLATSANWSTIKTSLTNYNLTFLKTNFIDQGYKLLLPANGSNSLAGPGSWAGYGIAARGVVTNGQTVYDTCAMLISGSYSGGHVSSSTAVVDPLYVSESGLLQSLNYITVSALVGSPYAADPVDMSDGSFRLASTDLSLGQAEPRGISFRRYYNSSRRLRNPAGMAPGWLHNYYLRASELSEPLAGLGDTTPAQMAALLVATRCACGIYETNGTPRGWAVTSLIAKWGIDQLINNAVSISLGEDTLQFVKQPDGTFTPPAKCTMTLLKTNGGFRLRERHGNNFKFNSAGLVTNIVDQYGKLLTVTYNQSNWVSTITDWQDRQLTLTYTNTPLRLESISDNSSPGRTVFYGYTTNAGQLELTGFSDAERKTSTFGYDTNHQMVATKDALNRLVVSNAYDAFGRVIEQYSQGDTNRTWRLFWSGYLNTEKDPAGGRKQYFFDDKHRKTRTVDALNHSTEFHYDGQDHLVETVSHLGARTAYFYDGRHNLVMTTDPLGCANRFVYDDADNLLRSVDARGKTSYFGYNSKFQLTGSTNGAGDWVKFAYRTDDGLLDTRTDPGGATSYDYGGVSQLKKITYPGNEIEGFLNNSLGDVLSHTNARKFVTSFQYNRRRELTNTIAPTNVTVRIAYDALGNAQSRTDARGFTASNTWSTTRKLLSTMLPPTPQGVPVVTNSYDSRDWLTRTLDPLQKPTSYTNDAAGRLVAVTDPLSRTARLGYDEDSRKIWTANAALETNRQTWNARGDLLQATDPAGRNVTRSYDSAGNQVFLTNRNGKVWQFRFDAANRLTNTISPLGRTTAQIYNNRGLLASVKEPSEDTANLSYDARGRLTNRTDSLGTLLYRCDPNNNVTNIVENGKTNSWTFDAYDRVSSYRDADGKLIQYGYDAAGNLTNLVYPGGKTVSYSFDSLNRLTNVTDWANRKTTIVYDLASRVRSITRPNGTVREMNYDAAGQVTHILERTGEGMPIALFKFNWDDAARMDWEFAAPLPHAYTPPARTMTYDDDNRIATFNGLTVVHDNDGNMTSGPLTNATLVSYTYDARNRLLSAGGLSYGYDPAGNRVTITNGTNVANLIVNPNAALSQVLIRAKPDGSKTFCVYGVGLLYEVNESSGGVETGTITYHYDYRGSTVALTDGNGTVTDRLEYSTYGNLAYRTGNTDTPFLFNGRYGVQTDSNGLLYMRARYYNPVICRFINPDPVGFAGALNWYAYADGNPISYLDPFGLGAVGENAGTSWLSLTGNGLNNTVSAIGQSMGQGLYDLTHLTWSQNEYNRIGDLMYSTATPENPAATPYVATALGVSAVATAVAGGGIICSAVGGGTVAGGGTVTVASGDGMIGVVVNGQVVPGSVMGLGTSHAVAAGAGGALTAEGALIPGAQAFTVFNSGGQITVLGSGTFGGAFNVSRTTVTAVRAFFSAAP